MAGVGRLGGEALQAQRLVDHRVRLAGGELVVTEVDHRMPLRWGMRVQAPLRPQRDVRADRAQPLAGDDHRLVAERAAGEQAPQRSGPLSTGLLSTGLLSTGPLSTVREHGPGVRRSAPGHRGQAGTCVPIPPSAASDHAERRSDPALPGRRTRSEPAWPAPPRSRAGRAATSGAGGLDTDDHGPGRRIVVQGGEGGAGRPAADRRGQVTPADAQGRAHPRPGRVEQAQHLLCARARGGNQPGRPGGEGVREAQPDTADDGCATVRAPSPAGPAAPRCP